MSNSTYWQHVPGESVYGLVANYHVGSPHKNWRQTNKEIFGRTHVRLHPVLPNHLNTIAKHFGLNVTHLLNTATGYPLYALSLGQKAKLLASNLCDSGGQSMSIESRQAASSLPLNKQFQYCQSCVESSFEQYGKLLWLTEHQLYGVSYCQKHGEILQFIPAGEGGINRRYILPQGGVPVLNEHNEKARYLSSYIIKLHRFLGQNNNLMDIGDYYDTWLNYREFLTPNGHVRSKLITKEMFSFWRPLFETTSIVVPLELTQFKYVSHIVHRRHPVHYLKHAMLMGFLTSEPEQFFRDKVQLNKPSKIIPLKVASNTSKVLELLIAGLSMRSVAKETGLSVGTIKQMALRNNLTVNRRRKKLTPAIERDIWRKAFLGIHRADIAEYHNISIGAVEQIIQSHQGLSDWRHHLMMARRKQFHRGQLQILLDENPTASRNQLKKSTSSYMWLYKNDKDWLYQHLPAAQSFKYSPSVNWSVRDKILAIKMRNMIKPAASLSALDRQLGGHGWLLNNSEKLPQTMAAAFHKIQIWKK